MIVDITDRNGVFKRMNRVLVEEYQRKGIMPDNNQHRDTFEQTYNVKVIVENSRWSAMEFPSEQDYLTTVLKWS